MFELYNTMMNNSGYLINFTLHYMLLEFVYNDNIYRKEFLYNHILDVNKIK